jgi:hypothetical protein
MGVSENAAYPQTQVQKGEHDDEPKDFVCTLHAELKDLGVLLYFWKNPYIHVYIYNPCHFRCSWGLTIFVGE